MKNERTKNATRNIVWGLMNKFVAIILPFISRTVMIYAMGALYLGINGLFTSVLQVLNVSELGISSAICFSMYKPIAEGNDEEVCALLNFYKRCYQIIGFVVLGVGLLLLPFLKNLISGEVPVDINIYILYLIQLVATVVSYQLFSYKATLLNALQRNDILSKVSTLIIGTQVIVQMLVLIIFKNYYLYLLVLVVCNIIKNITVHKISKELYPQYFCQGNISKQQFALIRQKVGGMIFQKIGGVVLSSVDTIVISAFLGLKILAIYQNYYYIITALFGILAVIMTSLIATVGNSIQTDTVEKNYKDFNKLNFLYTWIIIWCSICLICLYQPFMEIWVGKDLMLSYHMVILFAVYFFVHKWCDMLYVYQEACGIWWETKIVPLCAALVNLTVNLFLVKWIGLSGILISTIVSMLFIYNVGYAKVLFSVYFNQEGMLKKFIIKQVYYFIVAVVIAIFMLLLCNLINISPWGDLIIRGVICIILPNILMVIFLRPLEEFNEAKIQVVKSIKTIIKK